MHQVSSGMQMLKYLKDGITYKDNMSNITPNQWVTIFTTLLIIYFILLNINWIIKLWRLIRQNAKQDKINRDKLQGK